MLLKKTKDLYLIIYLLRHKKRKKEIQLKKDKDWIVKDQKLPKLYLKELN